MRCVLASLAGLSLAFNVACNGTASATFPVGTSIEVDAADLGLPMELMDGMLVATVPCGPMGMCPSSSEAPVTCEADVCNPAPQTLSIPVGDVVDIDELAGDIDTVFRSIDTVEILEINYRIERNTFSLDTEPIEVHWGPAGATALDETMGVRQLATVPRFMAGETGEGGVPLDSAGSAAFTDHFENTSHQFRFFARTSADLEPGQTWPSGSLRVEVTMRIRVAGSLI
jgi:hypothetical protein